MIDKTETIILDQSSIIVNSNRIFPRIDSLFLLRAISGQIKCILRHDEGLFQISKSGKVDTRTTKCPITRHVMTYNNSSLTFLNLRKFSSSQNNEIEIL